MWLWRTKTILRSFLVCFLIKVTIAEDESWLVYTPDLKETISVRPLSKNRTNETHIPAQGSVLALTFDLEEKQIYWSLKNGSILRANIDGTGPRIVLNLTTRERIVGLALDWITKNLYIVLKRKEEIRACDLSRKLCAVVVCGSNYVPFSISLHPQSGTMVWTNHGIKSAVFKANMDGSRPSQIHPKKPPFGYSNVVIDYALSYLHYFDRLSNRIQTSDLVGGNRSILKCTGNSSIQPIRLAVGGPNIYWFDMNTRSINKCNKYNGSVIEVEKYVPINSDIYFDMIWMGPRSQPNNRVNHCANHTCLYICVLTEISYRCLCNDGLILSQDGQHCEDAGPKMIISTNGGMYVLSMATQKLAKISNSISSSGLSYDFKNSKIYWAGGNNFSKIYRSNLNGSGSESVVTLSGMRITSLAYDGIAHNIYYTTGNNVGVCDGSGTNCAVLIHNPRDLPLDVVVSPRLGLMFWNAGAQSSSMRRAFMDGSFAESMRVNLEGLSSLAIDSESSQLLLWNQSGSNIITDFNFKTLQSNSLFLGPSNSVVVGGDFVYAIHNYVIHRCHKYYCHYTKPFKGFPSDTTLFEIRLFYREGQLQNRINHCSGGRCSHICVLTQKYFRCICPTGMYLTGDGRTCEELAGHGSFANETLDTVSTYTPLIFKPEDNNGGLIGFRGNERRWVCAGGTFLVLIDLCNGEKGCPDGTDEGPYCDIPCSKINFTDDGNDCIRTPNGPQILHPEGFLPGVHQVTSEGRTNAPDGIILASTTEIISTFEENKKLLEDLENQLKLPSANEGNVISSITRNTLNVIKSTQLSVTGPNQHTLIEKAIKIYSSLLTDDIALKNIENETEKSQTAYDLLVAIEKTILTVNSTYVAINETIEFNSSVLPTSEFKAAFGTVKSLLNGGVEITYPNSPPSGESFITVNALGFEDSDTPISFVGVSIDCKHIEGVMRPSLNRINNEHDSGSSEKIINSHVITLTVNDERMHAEGQRGNITTYVKFYHKVSAYGEKSLTLRRKLHPGEKPQAVRDSVACTYWSAKENLWITDGCEVYKTSQRSTYCKCDHLTSFAVIMDRHNYVGKDPVLEVLTLILGPISGVCLILTIILLSTIKSVQNQRTNITSHLCFCLLLGIILILFVADRNYLYLSFETCAAVGIVTHYWLLAAFTWMGLEGVCMYKMIIRVFDSHRVSTKLYVMAGYGLPAVLIAMTCAVGYGLGDEPYGNDLFCWLNGSYHWGFAGPVAATIIGNIIVLYLVVKAARNQGSFAPTANAKKRSNKIWIQGLFSMTILLGVTWLPGLIVLTNSEILATISAYFFVVLNASQGIFLFIFNCVLNEKVCKFVQGKKFWLATSSTSGPQVTALTRNVNTSTT